MAVTISTHSLTQVSQSKTDNTSKVRYLVKATTSGASFNNTDISTTYYINGVKYTHSHRLPANSTTTLVDKTATVKHNSDGTKTVKASFSCNTYISAGTLTGSKSLTLTPIPRKAEVTSGMDFNDEQNPKIYFSNPAGYSIVPYLNFYNSSNTLIHSISRPKGKHSSPYTFTLTDSERNSIRNALNKQKTYKVAEGVHSYDGSTDKGYDSIAKTFSFVNASPTFTSSQLTITDTNSTVTAITGGSELIQGKSIPRVAFTSATANKGATISSYKAEWLGQTKSGSSPLTFNEPSTSGETTLKFTVTDSRGFTKVVNKKVTVIPYNSPTATVKLSRVNNYEDSTKLLVKAYYSSIIAGGVERNSISKIEWRYKVVNGSYTSYATIPNNVEQSLSFNKNYDFTIDVKVTDALGGVWNKQFSLSKGIFPLFIDTSNNAVGINSFPQVGEALRVEGGIATFDEGIKLGTNELADIVIEEGTTDGWYYRKWLKGNCEAWKRSSFAVTFESKTGGGQGTIENVSYPSFFKSLDNVILTPRSSYFVALAYNPPDTTAKNFGISVARLFSSTDFTALGVSAYLQGKWK